MTGKNSITINTLGRRIFNALFFCALVLAGLYGYFVSTSVINVLVREEVERDVSVLTSRVSSLEAHYLVKKNEVTFEYAQVQGFHNLDEKHFATRISERPIGLTLNTQ